MNVIITRSQIYTEAHYCCAVCSSDIGGAYYINGSKTSHKMENGIEAKRVKMDDGSLFGHLDIYPPDPIFHVKDAYLADKSPNKVNLGIGGMKL